MHAADTDSSIDTLIIGGGISGLACAYYLKQRGARFRLIEAQSRAGGLMQTVSQAGFLSECGPNSLLASPTEPIRRLADDLGLAQSWMPSNAIQKKRYIYKDEELMALPMGPGQLWTTRLLSWGAKLSLLAEPWRRATKLADWRQESVHQFFSRRLGRQVADNFIDPMVTGIYACNAKDLSAAAAFPKIVALEREHGSLGKGLVKKLLATSSPRPVLGSFQAGMGSLPMAIAKCVADAIDYASRADRLELTKGGYRVHGSTDGQAKSWCARQLILALPAWGASELMAPTHPEISATLNRIMATPILSVTLGFKRQQVAHPLDGFGFLVPSSQALKLLGVLFNSTLFAGRAPAGHVTVTCMLGGARHPQMLAQDDAQILALLARELEQVLGIRGTPVWQQIHRWQRAVPRYGLDHLEIIENLHRQTTALPGLHFTGNFIDGISVAHCVQRAQQLVERIG